MHIEGVYVPIATPFHDNGDLDLSRLGLIVEHVLSAGCHGLVVAGTTGEYYALSNDERVSVFEKAFELNAGRAVMVAGCNAGSTREIVAYAQTAKAIGYDAIMLAAPATSLPRQHELAAHFVRVAEDGGLPVILYNYPARAGVEIGFECLDAIADHPGIVGLKESSGDFSRFLALRRRYEDRITIMCGSDDQAADYFVWGVRSWLAGTANVLPAHHVALMDAANRGDLEVARSAFAAILPWVQHMEEGQYNQKVKIGLAMQGIDLGPVRQPLLPLLPDDDAVTREFITGALAAPLAANPATV
jgi:4-hydroxy-tetrahydrodipicolinate synthase